MPEPLKNVYNQKFIQDLGNRLREVNPSFPDKAFIRSVFSGDWAALELKARMARISDKLHEHLNGGFAENAATLSAVAKSYRTSGNTGFEYMFLPDYIEKHGLQDFKTSMTALAAITETGSAEFAIRPFIQNFEARSLKQLLSWSKSKDEHLRRLASEGCRPRLPWAMALPRFKADPAPILPILEQLKNDPSLYVRRSVANNLNDISKDHPDLVIDLASNWLGHSEETDWLVKHACRGLLKAGRSDAMVLFGFAEPKTLKLHQFKLSSDRVQFGEALQFTFKVKSPNAIGKLRLEYGIDFVKANGALSRKVFSISEKTWRDTEALVSKKHKFVPISTRVHYPGKHGIAIIANGVELQHKTFHLEIEEPG